MMYDENKWNDPVNPEETNEMETSQTEVETIPEASQTRAAEESPVQQAEQTSGSGQTTYPNHYPYQDQSQNQNQYRSQSSYRGQNPYQEPNRTQGQYQYQSSYQNNRQQNDYSRYEPKKKGNSIFKKTILVTAGALLFGTVAGATMFGVNRVAEKLFPSDIPAVQQETQASELPSVAVPEAETQQAQNMNNAATGVVIEDVSPIVEAAMPSVVAINNTMLYQSNTWFGQSQTYEVPSSGSGIIVGENETELLIVTNHHVIEDANTLSVTFIDESTVDAAVKGTDADSDLAVIAIPLEDIAADTKAQIKAATIGDSDSLKMGQGVIAIGNALGLGQSVTVGHVSALNREISVDGVTRTVIQTDAAINPGNSGGALLNSKGELIGINEAKYSDESVEGVGYAIPITYAMDIVEDLKVRTTKVAVDESEQGYLGIQVQNVDSTTAQMLGMPEGVYVYKIMEDSAASESDLREKDIITEFDGERVRTNSDLTELLTYYKSGTTVTMTVQSLEDGAYVEREVEITLKNRPVEEEETPTQESVTDRLLRPRP